MKFRVPLFSLIAALPFYAQAAENDGFFVDGSIGRGSVESFWPHSTAWRFDAGYHWDWFSVDLGYVDFSRVKLSAYGNSTPPKTWEYTASLAQHGVTADVGGRWHIGTNWYYSAKAGAYFWQNSSSVNSSTTLQIKWHDSGVTANASLGFGYQLSQHASIGLEYDWYNPDGHAVHPLSLTADYRF